jgi:hypothetical protein
MNKEQKTLIDEAYENYCKEYENGTHRIGTGLLWMAKETKDTFVYRSKADSEFSEKWGLTIEERELTTVRERKKYDIHFDDLIGEYPDHHETLDKRGVPKKITTITYNDKTITNYE